MSLLKAEKILIRCPNWVGDFVMATPALRAMRENYPRAHISLLLRPYLRGLIEGSAWYDQLIEYEPRGQHKGPSSYFNFIKRLRAEGFDLELILPNSFSSAMMGFLSGIPQRIGYSREGRGFLLTQSIKPLRDGLKIVPQNMVDYYLNFCHALGCSQSSSRKIELPLSEASLKEAEALLKKYQVDEGAMTVGINPGASFGSSKLWKLPYFAQLSDALIERFGCQVLILSSPKERPLALEIEEHMRQKPINLGLEDIPLALLKALVSKLSLLITTDSGPRHLAVAFDKPVVVIMGPTDPRYTDYPSEKTMVLREDVECSPCHKKVCPTDHRCMSLLGPEKVLKAVDTLMEGGRKPF